MLLEGLLKFRFPSAKNDLILLWHLFCQHVSKQSTQAGAFHFGKKRLKNNFEKTIAILYKKVYNTITIEQRELVLQAERKV